MNRSNLIDNREDVEKNKKYNSIPSDRFYTEKEEATLRFYQVPKALFKNPVYESLDLGPKLMYSVLRDRLDLSIKNRWQDENGFIYLIFSIEDLANILEIDRKAVMRYKKSLVDYKLIIDRRLGQGRCNRIYVLKPELWDIQKSQIGTSRSSKIVPLEVPIKDTSDTYIKETNLNNVNGVSEEKVVENSDNEIERATERNEEDISDIRRKIQESLKDEGKCGFAKPKNFKNCKNIDSIEKYSKGSEIERTPKLKRYRSREKEELVKEIAEELNDNHSLGAFRAIVDKISEQRIRIFLSIIKGTYLTGKIKKNGGAMFISLAKAYAGKNNINLNFK